MYRERFEFAVQHFCVSYCLLICLFWLVRIAEFVLVAYAQLLPENPLPLIAAGFALDVWFCLFLAVLTFPFYIASYIAIGSFTRYFLAVGFLLFLLVYLALVQYYVQTSIPLSSDFWGYSLDDIRITIASSAKVQFSSFIPFVAVLGVFFYTYRKAQEIILPYGVLYLFYGLTLLSSVLYLVKTPDSRWFDNDSRYTFSVNKIAFFSERSVAFCLEYPQEEKNNAIAEYPLMHEADSADVLSPFFNAFIQKPNLVFVVVEGLGGTFVGPDARYGGCTPFLDSLAQHGLYWQNTLSTTGRTFGVLSSLLGSLPYSDRGFLETGSNMPAHLTLISLLKQNGYNTRFFYGGDAHFDLQDVFLERQGVDYILGQDKFPPTYQKLEANSEGFSWGYSDVDVFKRSLELFPADTTKPTLSVYLTLNTHEPFKVPNQQKYLALLHKVAATHNQTKQREYKRYESEFSSLLYTDDAIRSFIDQYKSRTDYSNTIFIITGDHRMIPIPQANRIDRFHVPLVVFSPKLKRAQRFKSINTHHDVTPTLVSFLGHQTDMKFPEKVHWLGHIMDTTIAFHSTRDIALMRNKNELIDYIDGRYFLSDKIAYRITPKLDLERLSPNSSEEKQLKQKMAAFKQMNGYVVANNKIYNDSLGHAKQVEFTFTNREKLTLRFMGIDKMNAEQMFAAALKRAEVKQFSNVRLICKWCLVSNPNFIDMRLVLGRAYSWEGNYEEAKQQFAESVKRAPLNDEAWLALIDNELFYKQYEKALEFSEQAYALFPKSNYTERMKLAKAGIKEKGSNPEPKI
ncbi:MAG: sulfatase-like hydrolase/transferase [Bacteroidota bacterium]